MVEFDDDDDGVADWDAFDAVVAQHIQQKQLGQATQQQQMQPGISPHAPMSPGAGAAVPTAAAAGPSGVRAQPHAAGRPHANDQHQPHAQDQQPQPTTPRRHQNPAGPGPAVPAKRPPTGRTPPGKRFGGLATAPSPARGHAAAPAGTFGNGGSVHAAAQHGQQHVQQPHGLAAQQQHHQQQRRMHQQPAQQQFQHQQQPAAPRQLQQGAMQHQNTIPAPQPRNAGQPYAGPAGNQAGHAAQAGPPPHQQPQQAPPPQQQTAGPAAGLEVAQLRQQLQQAQERLAQEQGTTALLRGKVERFERQGVTPSQGVPPPAVAPAAVVGRGGGPLAALGAPDLQRELDSARERLTFQEQEVTDLRRQMAERTQRLNEAQAAAEAARKEAARVAEAKAQLEGELQAAQQQRGSGGSRGSGGAAAADAAAAQLSPRVPSPQEDARRPVSGQKRRLDTSDSAAPPAAATTLGRAGSGAASARGDPVASSGAVTAVGSGGRRSSSSMQPGSGGGRSSSGATAAAEEPRTDFGRGLLPPHAQQHWASAGTAPIYLQAVPASNLAISAAFSGLPANSHAAGSMAGSDVANVVGPSSLLQRLWAAAPAAMAALLAAPVAQQPAADPWAPRDRRPPWLITAQCSATAAVQEELRLLGAAPGLQRGSASLLDALCALLLALVPPPPPAPAPAADPAAVAPASSRAQAAVEGQVAALAAAALAAAEALLRHDATSRAAALASCGMLQGQHVAHSIDSGAAAAEGGGRSASAGDTAAEAAPGRGGPGPQSSNVQLVGPDGAPVQLPAPPWGRTSAAPPQPAGLQTLRAEIGSHGARGMLALLLRLVMAELPKDAAAAAAGALAALVAAAPAEAGRAAMLPVMLSGALERVASGGDGERAAAPALLADLLAEPAVAATLQASLAAEDAGTQTQTQVPEGAAAADGSGSGGVGGAWMGSWQLLRAWLGLLVLPAAGPHPRTLAQALHGMALQTPPSTQQVAAPAAAAAAGVSQQAAAVCSHPRDFWEEDPHGECAVARGAVAVVAAALSRRQTWLVLALLADDGGIGAGGGLAQHLVGLVDAATRDPGGGVLEGLQAAPCPGADFASPRPPFERPADRGTSSGDRSITSGGSSSAADDSAARAAWAQRLRLVQEALILLRSLLADPALGGAAMADLTASPSSAREALTVAHRLASWRLPPGIAGDADAQQALFVAPALARWAAIAGAAGGLVFRSPPIRGITARPSLEDVRFLARTLRQRLVAQADANMRS